MAWLSGWSYRKAVTIDSSLIDADITDFPVVVKLTSSNFDFSKALSNGNDIRFTSDDGTTLLKYERERHDSANSLAEYWIKVPSVSSASDTTFYIYYGKSDAIDGADPTNVWDSHFKGVWHLNQDPSGTAPQELDSTANGNNGTSGGSMTSDDLVEGQVDGALDFDGSDDNIVVPYDVSLDMATNLSISFWFKSNTDISGSDIGGLISKSNSGTNSEDDWVFFWDGNDDGRLRWGTYGDSIQTTTNTWTAGVRYRIAVVHISSTEAYIYVNEAEDNYNSDYNPGAINGTADNPIKIGVAQIEDGNYFLNGTIDEVRISNIARSAAYIKASYNSENDSLLTFGAEAAVATLSDTLNLSEVLQPLAGYRASLTDSLNLSETISPIGHFSRVFSDTLNLTDVFRAFLAAYLSDTLSLTDSVSAKAAHLANISDTLTLSDAISALGKFKVTLNDTLDITDALKAGLAGKLSDTLTLSDAVSVLARYIAKISDTLNFTDETFSIIVAKGKLTITFSSSKSTITFTPSNRQ